MSHKVENRLMKNEIFMIIYRENGPLITRVKLLLEWEILADMFADILMDFRRFMEDLAVAKNPRVNIVISIL